MALTRQNGNSFVFEKTEMVELYLQLVNEDIDIFKFFTRLTSVKEGQLVGKLILGDVIWKAVEHCDSNPTKVDIGYDVRKWNIKCAETEMEHCFKNEICNILQQDYSIDMVNDPEILSEIELLLIDQIIRKGIVKLLHRHVLLGNENSTNQAGGQFAFNDGIFRQLLPYIKTGVTGLVQSVDFNTAPVFPNLGTYKPLVAGDGIKILEALYKAHESNVLFRERDQSEKFIIVTYGLYKQYEEDLKALACCNSTANNPIDIRLQGLNYNGQYLTFEGIPVIYLNTQSEYYAQLYAMKGAEFALMTIERNLIYGTNEDGIASEFETDTRKKTIWMKTKVCFGFNFSQPEFIAVALPEGSVYAVGTTPAIGTEPNGLFA
jgi:hypothetical protein